MGSLRDKVAIITGAGRGIGAAIARRFSKEGARVVLTSRTAPEIERLADEIGPKGNGAIAIPSDVTNQKEIDNCIRGCMDTFGRLDILVNCAGSHYVSSVGMSEPHHWIYDFDVNVVGTYRYCRSALPHLTESKNGRIVNIASRFGKSPGPLASSYSASKAAVIAFTTSLAAEVARDGIHVNAICPGYVETKLLNDAIADASKITGREPLELKQRLAKRTMFRRAVSADEVASLALFLVSEGTGMTGQAINVTAGAETH